MATALWKRQAATMDADNRECIVGVRCKGVVD